VLPDGQVSFFFLGSIKALLKGSIKGFVFKSLLRVSIEGAMKALIRLYSGSMKALLRGSIEGFANALTVVTQP
jgi:hypothetical protein